MIYDVRARDGTWCTLPYPNHKRGCPNFPKCIDDYPDWLSIVSGYHWIAVLERFDLKEQERRMLRKHPRWSTRQARCVLYWQNGVRKRLRESCREIMEDGDILIEIPEACGVNVFATLAKAGVHLKANPDLVIKMMLVGKPLNIS